MELKSRQYETSLRSFASSNRTFMELKYYQSPIEVIANLGSNRTFMELKWRSCIYFVTSSSVLIAPLWN